MTPPAAPRSRAPRTASAIATLPVLAVALVLIAVLGAGPAAAYWTAAASLTRSASAASVGLTHEFRPTGTPTGLSASYTAETTTLAGAVAITNTGSREAAATFSLAATAGSGASPALREAVSVLAAPVGGAEDCTPQRALVDPVRATLTAGATLEGVRIGAGQTLIVCAQTSLPSGGLTTFAGQQVDLSLTSALRVAAGEQWSVRSQTPLRAVQTIGKDRFAGLTQLAVSGGNPTVSWPSAGQGARYRLYLARASTPRTLVSFSPAGQATLSTTSVAFHVSTDQAELQRFVTSPQGGYGATRLYVEASTDGGTTWALTASAALELSNSGGSVHVKGV